MQNLVGIGRRNLSLDTDVFRWLFSYATDYPIIGQIFAHITYLSGPVFAFVYIGFILKMCLGKHKRVVFPLLIGTGLALFSVEFIRFFYARPRPFVQLDIDSLIYHSASGSFPSRHAVSAFAIATAIRYIDRRVGRWLLLLAVITGLSRVMVGVHFPLDVLGGGVLGYWICQTALSLYAGNRPSKRQGNDVGSKPD